LLLLPQAGCYNIRPVSTPEAAPGARVVATLTDAGSVGIASQVGPRVVEVEGVIQQVTADTLQMGVVRTVDRSDMESLWNGEMVRIPVAGIGSLRERQLSTRKSVLAAAIIVVGALLLAAAASGVGVFDGGPPPTPTPPN
ncbi:hypothetical protein, partial [Longimicrobium sp.]|uniref:hypothetical protein n=1 Tax=Longimicrobium sp. TaxID=2029185 RepID=UPI002F94ACC8